MVASVTFSGLKAIEFRAFTFISIPTTQEKILRDSDGDRIANGDRQSLNG